VLSWQDRSFSRIKKFEIARPLAHIAKATRARMELVVSLLRLPLVRKFLNVIGVAKLGMSKDFA